MTCHSVSVKIAVLPVTNRHSRVLEAMAPSIEITGRKGEEYAQKHLPNLFPGADVYPVSGLLTMGRYMFNNEALVDLVMEHEGTAYLVEVSSTEEESKSGWCGLQLHQRDLALQLTASRQPTMDLALAKQLRLPQKVYTSLLRKPIKYLVIRVVVGHQPRVAFMLEDPAQMVTDRRLKWREVEATNNRNGKVWVSCEPAKGLAASQPMQAPAPEVPLPAARAPLPALLPASKVTATSAAPDAEWELLERIMGSLSVSTGSSSGNAGR